MALRDTGAIAAIAAMAVAWTSTTALASDYAVNSSLMLSTRSETQGESDDVDMALQTNFTAGLLTSDGYFAGGKVLYNSTSSESSDGIDNLVDNLASLGGSVGLVSKKGFSAIGTLLMLPTRKIESSASYTYYGGLGWMLDLGYALPFGKSALGLQFSVARINFEKRTSERDAEENLEGDHTLLIAQPYISVWIFI